MRRAGFVLPTGLLLIGLISTILFFRVTAYKSAILAERNSQIYWKIQTITSKVNQEYLLYPDKTEYEVDNGHASLKGSQLTIKLNSGETATEHVWERKQILK